jgi:hypothetical protein
VETAAQELFLQLQAKEFFMLAVVVVVFIATLLVRLQDWEPLEGEMEAAYYH